MLKTYFTIVVFPFAGSAFYAAFLFEGTHTGGVGNFIEIIQTLADGSKIARCQIFDCFQSPAFGSRKFSCKHPLKKDRFSVVIQIVEAQFEGEPPHDRRIKILHKVGRSDHNAVEVFHLIQQLIDLRNFPTAIGSLAVLHQTVDFVQNKIACSASA